VWEETGDRLQGQRYLSRVDHIWKSRARRKGREVGKYCYVNRTIADWNQLAEGEMRDYNGKLHTVRKRIRKVLKSEGK
jgi:hypothetical protein